MHSQATRNRSRLSGPRSCLTILAATGLLTACALVKTAPPEQVVKDRANGRWEVLIKRDMHKAYEFTAPSYRAVVSEDTYGKKIGSAVSWIGAQVVSVACEAAKCVATVRVEAKPLLGAKLGNTISLDVDETWLLEDGHWWFFPKL